MRHADTAEEAMSRYVNAYQSLSGSERVARAMEMAEEVKAITMQGIHDRNPEFTEAEARTEWLRILHGDEVVKAIQAEQVARSKSTLGG